jgi:hypothetical protein
VSSGFSTCSGSGSVRPARTRSGRCAPLGGSPTISSPAGHSRPASGSSCSAPWERPGSATARCRRSCSASAAPSPSGRPRRGRRHDARGCHETGKLRLAGTSDIDFSIDRDIVLSPTSSSQDTQRHEVHGSSGTTPSSPSTTRWAAGSSRPRTSSTRPIAVTTTTRCRTRSAAPTSCRPVRTARAVDRAARDGERSRHAARTRRARRSSSRSGGRCASASSGCATDGVLPGGLGVQRRAAALHRSLTARVGSPDPLTALDWVNLWALAVNEENAAGGRVVTAPTNGAAGIVPAVLHYYWHFVPGADDDGVVDFLLAAGAIGALFKMNASISGAEVGCQGEVGSACAMAAAGLTQVMGGSPARSRTPQRSRSSTTSGSPATRSAGWCRCRASSATRWRPRRRSTPPPGAARRRHPPRLARQAIETLRQTGRDMLDSYKETARGGLAGHLPPTRWRSRARPGEHHRVLNRLAGLSRRSLPSGARSDGSTRPRTPSGGCG